MRRKESTEVISQKTNSTMRSSAVTSPNMAPANATSCAANEPMSCASALK